MHGIGFDAQSAVPLNLLTSLVTLTFALAIRSGAVSLGAVFPYLPEMAGLLAGGMVSAFYGAQLVNRLSDRRLVLLIAVLLGALGLLLITEAVLPFQSGDLLPAGTAAHFGAGAVIGSRPSSSSPSELRVARAAGPHGDIVKVLEDWEARWSARLLVLISAGRSDGVCRSAALAG